MIIVKITPTVAHPMIEILFHIKTLLIVWFECEFCSTCKTIARLNCFIKALFTTEANFDMRVPKLT